MSEENNVLIAEFMGYTKTSLETRMKWVGVDNEERFLRMNQEYIPILEKEKDVLFIDTMSYNTSWNWLMPVIEKIETTKFELKNYANNYSKKHDRKSSYAWILNSFDPREEFFGWDVNIELESLSKMFYSTIGENPRCQTKLEATYSVIVQFIKWYNENKL